MSNIETVFKENTSLDDKMYLSETKQQIVPKFEEGLSEEAKSAVESRPAAAQPSEAGADGQWDGAAARAARSRNQPRELDLRVPEMPFSGSAENPTYLNLARYTPQEIEVCGCTGLAVFEATVPS